MIEVQKNQNLSVKISNSKHSIISDVVTKLGGDDLGLDAHELLESSLGACTSITVMMYAKRKNWPLLDVQTKVKITQETQENIITREVHLVGELDDEQKARLIQIANKCPIHNFLERKTSIITTEI